MVTLGPLRPLGPLVPMHWLNIRCIRLWREAVYSGYFIFLVLWPEDITIVRQIVAINPYISMQIMSIRKVWNCALTQFILVTVNVRYFLWVIDDSIWTSMPRQGYVIETHYISEPIMFNVWFRMMSQCRSVSMKGVRPLAAHPLFHWQADYKH